MALIVPVAGPYLSSHTPGASASGHGTTGVSLGIMSDDGYSLRWVLHKQKIGNDGTDQYGLSRLENVIRGGDWNIIFRAREYAAGVMNVAWNHGKVAAGGALSPVMAQAGACDDTSGYSGALVLTAILGTPAVGNPATLTAAKTVQSDGQQLAMEFTSKLREVPVNLELLPYVQVISAVPYILWFSTT